MANKPLPSPELLRQLIRFDSDTGKYFWLPRPRQMFPNEWLCKSWNNRCAGKETMNEPTSDGYFRIKLFGQRIRAHRVVWAYHHGQWPTDQIDHINHTRTDNRIENLRQTTLSGNARNQSIQKRNKSGMTGVSWHSKHCKWRASIKIMGKHIHLGLFSSVDEAKAVRMQANKDFNFHANHGK